MRLNVRTNRIHSVGEVEATVGMQTSTGKIVSIDEAAGVLETVYDGCSPMKHGGRHGYLPDVYKCYVRPRDIIEPAT